MTLACAHCGSHYMVEDYDTESHRTIGYKCGLCGRDKFDEQKETIMAGKCRAEGCTKMIYKGGFCSTHYKEKYGVSPRKRCSVDGCDKQSFKGSMCMVHWREATGTPKKPTGGNTRKRGTSRRAFPGGV